MSKETLFIIIRTLLSGVGAFLIGKNIFGISVDDSVLQIIVGGIMAAVSIVWGIVDKSAGIEQIQSSIRQIFVLIGGLLVSAGKVSAENLETYLGFALALVTIIYSVTSKKKTQQIASGQLLVVETKTPVGQKTPNATVVAPEKMERVKEPITNVVGNTSPTIKKP